MADPARGGRSAHGAVERTGLAIRDPVPWHDLVEVVRTAEQTGYETLFLPETTGREAFSTLAALAVRTEAIGLATGVVPIGARSLPVTAMAAATVHELSGGRLVLGLGAGAPVPGALDRLRAAVAALRRALRGEGADDPDEGSFRLSLDAGPRPPEIWIAALGPRAMRLAGEVADGVLLNWCPPERVAVARERVAEGARAAGRPPADVTVAVYVRAVVGQDDGVAMPALQAAAAQYASYGAYRRQFEQTGLGAAAAAAAAAMREGRPEAVPEELIRAVCVMGEAAAAGARLRRYREAGADLPVVYPVPVLDPVSSVLGTLFGLAPTPAVET